VQNPERFEGGPPETLVLARGGSLEQAGLQMAVTLAGAEKVEIRWLA
jgi:hypothetical protein